MVQERRRACRELLEESLYPRRACPGGPAQGSPSSVCAGPGMAVGSLALGHVLDHRWKNGGQSQGVSVTGPAAERLSCGCHAEASPLAAFPQLFSLSIPH